jgi:hypothetical protein
MKSMWIPRIVFEEIGDESVWVMVVPGDVIARNCWITGQQAGFIGGTYSLAICRRTRWHSDLHENSRPGRTPASAAFWALRR